MKLRTFPLRYSLPSVLLLGALIIALSSYAYNYRLAKDEVKSEAQHEVLNLRRIRNELEYAMQRDDISRVRYLVAELSADYKVVHGYFIDDQDRVLAATEQGLIGSIYTLSDELVSKTRGLIPAVNVQGSKLYTVYPLSLSAKSNELRPSRLGYLYVEMDLSKHLLQTLHHTKLQAISFGGFLVLIAFLMWLYFHRNIERRMARLQEGIKNIGAGKLSTRINFQTEDELGELAQGFNLMAEQLQEQQGHLTSLQEALDEHAIVSIADIDGLITYVNDRFCEISGYTHEELIGQNHRIVKSDHHDAAFYKNLWKSISHGNIWQGVIQNRSKSGNLYWVQSTIVPMLDENLKPKQYISVRTDVTQRERIRYAMEQLAIATTGDQSYNDIVHAVSIGLECRWVGFGQLFDGGKQVQVLGFWNGGQAGDSFTYNLEGTPCAEVCSLSQPLVVGNNVAKLYPNDQILTDMGAVCYRGEPLLEDDGSVIGILFAIDDRPCQEDESDRALLRMAAKRATLEIKRTEFEETLRQNETQLANAQQMARLGSWSLDLSNNKLLWSDEVFHIFELDKNSFAPSYEAFVEAIHPDDRQLVDEAYKISLAEKQPYSVIHRLLMKNGKIKWVHERGETQYDDEGNPVMSTGYVHDITEHKIMEKELQESEQRFNISQTFSNIGTFEWNIKNNQTYWSPQIWKLLGLSDKTVAPSFDAYISRVHPDDRDYLHDTVMKCVASGGDIDMEYRLVWPDNSHHWVRGRGGVERDSQGQPIRMLGVIMDIDAQKFAEEKHNNVMVQLQQAQKMESIGQLTGGIAHDFNNILASINGFSELAMELYGDQDSGKLHEYLGEVLQAGERGRDLVMQMLTFGRERPGELKSVDVNPIMKEVSRLLSSTLPSSITLKMHMDKDVPNALVDPVQLHQVLTNMVINARDAAGEHGHITLTLSKPVNFKETCSSCHQMFGGEFIEISIEDDGHGISEEQQARIFEPFFTTKEVGKGSGMGLAMVHGILHQSRGHILLDSKAGKGTRFRLLLPLADADVSSTQNTDGKKPAKDVAGKTVMIVDDEQGVTNFLKELLSLHHYKVQIFNNALKALEWFRDNTDIPDLIITDQTMPELTGAELAHKVLAIRTDIPIILCTGYSETIDEEMAERIGIAAYMNKPVASQALLDCIARQLQPKKQAVG